MRDTVDGLLKQVKDFFSGLSQKERRRFAVLGGLILVLSITAAWLLGRTTWAVLVTGVDPTTANLYVSALDEIGVKNKLQDGGATILVPDNQVTQTRVTLAGMNLTGSSSALDIYSLSTDLGVTAEDRKFYTARAYEQLLKEQIERQTYIKQASVIVSLGDTSSYVLGNSTEATATIMVDVVGGGRLSDVQASTILEMAAGAVSGLTAANVSLADSAGYLYSSLGGEGVGTSGLDYQLSLTEQAERLIERNLNNLFVPVVGANNLNLGVTVTLEFDSVAIEQVEFSPPIEGNDQGMLASLYQLWENSRVGNEGEGIPGSDSNGIGTVEYPYGTLGEDEYYNKHIYQGNYELNEVRTSIEKAKGTIKDLSVSIIYNGNAIAEDYTETFAQLAAGALGVDAKYITVSRLPFQEVEPTPEATGIGEKTMDIIMLAIKAAVVLFLGLAIIGLIRSIFKATRKEQLVLADGTGMNVDYVAGEAIEYDEDGNPIYSVADDVESETLPSLKDIDLNAKTEDIMQLESFIDKDPAAVAQLLRNWLSDD